MTEVYLSNETNIKLKVPQHEKNRHFFGIKIKVYLEYRSGIFSKGYIFLLEDYLPVSCTGIGDECLLCKKCLDHFRVRQKITLCNENY